jgi:hypothetical protein
LVFRDQRDSVEAAVIAAYAERGRPQPSVSIAVPSASAQRLRWETDLYDDVH